MNYSQMQFTRGRGAGRGRPYSRGGSRAATPTLSESFSSISVEKQRIVNLIEKEKDDALKAYKAKFEADVKAETEAMKLGASSLQAANNAKAHAHFRMNGLGTGTLVLGSSFKPKKGQNDKTTVTMVVQITMKAGKFANVGKGWFDPTGAPIPNLDNSLFKIAKKNLKASNEIKLPLYNSNVDAALKVPPIYIDTPKDQLMELGSSNVWIKKDVSSGDPDSKYIAMYRLKFE
jgi:uncharacterized glyoxalase superfamily protein PhnB